jgi:hypothetical protein
MTGGVVRGGSGVAEQEKVAVPGATRAFVLGSCAATEKPAPPSRLSYPDDANTDYFFSIAPLSLLVSFFILLFFFILFIELIESLSLVGAPVAVV